MKQPEVLLPESEERLNKALVDYEAPSTSALGKEFYELRVQAAIFNYDVSYDVVSLWRNQPSGFSEKVALKNLVHKLYEYDELLSKHLLARILKLAQNRKVSVQSEDVREQRRKWSAQFTKLRSWSNLRNQASGHYGKQTAAQVTLLKELQRGQVMEVAAAFLSFNIWVLKLLARTGRATSDA